MDMMVSNWNELALNLIWVVCMEAPLTMMDEFAQIPRISSHIFMMSK